MLCSAIFDAVYTRDTSGVDHFCSGPLRCELSFDVIAANHSFLFRTPLVQLVGKNYFAATDAFS
jgi:hypothetical protein